MTFNLKQQNDNSGQTNACLINFANTLQEFQVERLNAQNEYMDPINIIKEYRSIASEMALQLADESIDSTLPDTGNPRFLDWQLEVKFWHLLELLLSFRTSNIDEKEPVEIPFAYNSNSMYEKKLLHSDKKLYEIWLIIIWLQSNRVQTIRPINLPVTKWSNTLISGGLKSFDVDEPLRDSSSVIDERDINQDSIFFKYIFELLLLGKFDKILEECKLSENYTLAMIICGLQEYSNPKIDGTDNTDIDIDMDSDIDIVTEKQQHGIKKHALWRRSVYLLSQNQKLDKYERAIYSYLSGTIPDNEILKEFDWETHLLIYLNQILQNNIEKYLISKSRVDSKEIYINLPSNEISLNELFNFLATKHPEESEHPIRILIGSVILDTLPSIIHSSVELLSNIVNGKENDNDLINEPYLLRLMTHLTIILDCFADKNMSIPNEDKSPLITAYVTLLRISKLFQLLPIYINFLNERDALESYSLILSTIDDPNIRHEQLRISNMLRIPMPNILKRTTQNIFNSTENDYIPKDSIDITFKVTETDNHLMLGVIWLFEGKLFKDGITSFIALSRRFLLNGKITSLQTFYSSIDLDDIFKNYDLEKLITEDGNYEASNEKTDDHIVEELKQYKNLIDTFEKFQIWVNTIKELNSQSNPSSTMLKLQEYPKYIENLIKTFLVHLTNEDVSNSQEDLAILYEIRALYITYLIMELHKGLVDAGKMMQINKLIKEALNYSSLVANETDKVYLLFQSCGKLKEYLHLVAQTATLL